MRDEKKEIDDDVEEFWFLLIGLTCVMIESQKRRKGFTKYRLNHININICL